MLRSHKELHSIKNIVYDRSFVSPQAKKCIRCCCRYGKNVPQDHKHYYRQDQPCADNDKITDVPEPQFDVCLQVFGVDVGFQFITLLKNYIISISSSSSSSGVDNSLNTSFILSHSFSLSTPISCGSLNLLSTFDTYTVTFPFLSVSFFV